MKVWTKQHQNILHDLRENGRYIVKREYIRNKMEEHSGFYLDVYFWLHQALSGRMAFYPNIKSKIMKSWDRLFDDSVELSPARVGIIWEVRQEWITGIEQ